MPDKYFQIEMLMRQLIYWAVVLHLKDNCVLKRLIVLETETEFCVH